MNSASPGSSGAAKSGGRWIVLAAIVVVAVLAVAALVASRGSGDRGVSTAANLPAGATDVVTAPVEVGGEALPSMPQNGADPAVGQTFPTLSGTSLLTGEALAISDDGRAKLILFVAHWCPHCQREVPAVQTWLADNPLPADVDLYAVSTAADASAGNFPPANWLREEGWTAPTLADSDTRTAFQAAGLTGFPSFVAVSADGTVAERTSGELSGDKLDALVAKARA